MIDYVHEKVRYRYLLRLTMAYHVQAEINSTARITQAYRPHQSPTRDCCTIITNSDAVCRMQVK